MILTYRGSVNRWECDENDHMNVRFYMMRHYQALYGHPGKPSGAITVQHVRFHRESRLAEPLSGYTGIVGSGEGYVEFLTELKSDGLEETVSTCIHRIACEVAAEVDCNLPEHAQPRGVHDRESQWFGLAPGDLATLGFHPIGAGHILDAEVDGAHQLIPYHYMGRLSDSMPHLWRHLERGSDDTLGGAVLEYRLGFHQPLTLGDTFRILSGISDAAGKLQHFVHFMFNSRDELCMTAQAVGVRMDLNTRKALVLDDTALARISNVLLRKP